MVPISALDPLLHALCFSLEFWGISKYLKPKIFNVLYHIDTAHMTYHPSTILEECFSLPHIDVHHTVIVLQCGVLHRSHCQDPPAVHQHVQLSKVTDCLLYNPLEDLLICQIPRDQEGL